MAVKFDARGGRLSRVVPKRPQQTESTPQSVTPVDASGEDAPLRISATNLLQAVDNPALIVDSNRIVLGMNAAFRELFMLKIEDFTNGMDFASLARLCSMRGRSELIALGSHPDNAGPMLPTEIDGAGGQKFDTNSSDLGGGARLFTMRPLDNGSSLGNGAGTGGASEQTSAKTEASFREAIENITDGVALFNADERLVQCNRRYLEIWPSIEAVAIPGTSFEDIVHAQVSARNPKNPEKHIANRLEYFRNAPSVKEVELGDHRWIQITDTPMSDGGTVVTCTDITALKEREERLRDVSNDALHAKEMAEIANRSKSDFLANMSHELRTPLNAIIGFSEIIKDSLLGDDQLDQYRVYASDIHDSGTHLLALINDILDMSRIEAGKAEIAEDEISVTDAIDASIRLVDERARKQSISIDRNFEEGLPMLRGDLRKLKQILINLLSNAVKFTQDGGQITVSASITASGRMLIGVADNGIGIADEDLAKVMEPFGQADTGLDRQYEGTGLGLTLTKGLVELHGGTFTLKSAVEGPDKGTTASAIFPAQRVINPQ